MTAAATAAPWLDRRAGDGEAATERPILLHPGFAKTATTTLQEGLFDTHPDIGFLGRTRDGRSLDRLIHRISREDSITFDHAAVRAALAAAIDAVPATRRLLISCENFSLYEVADRGMVAARLARLFPNATILFTIRNQNALLSAWYFQKMKKYVKGGHWLSLEEYVRLKSKEPHRSIIGDLDFAPRVFHYVQLFGADRVHVLPFELLHSDRAAFAGRLAGLLNIGAEAVEARLAREPLNPRLGTAYVDFHRRYGRWLPGYIARKIGTHVAQSGRGTPLETQLPTRIRRLVAANCARGNARLDAAFGLGLGEFGYPLSSDDD